MNKTNSYFSPIFLICYNKLNHKVRNDSFKESQKFNNNFLEGKGKIFHFNNIKVNHYYIGIMAHESIFSWISIENNQIYLHGLFSYYGCFHDKEIFYWNGNIVVNENNKEFDFILEQISLDNKHNFNIT